MNKIILCLVIIISFFYLSCSSEKDVVSIISLKYLGPKSVLKNYSSSDYILYNNTFGSHYTVVKNGVTDTVLGINLITGSVTKVAMSDIITEKYLLKNFKGLFSFVNDSLLVYVSSVAEDNMNDNHNQIIRIFNVHSKDLRFFKFNNLPVLLTDSTGRNYPNSRSLPHSELNYSKWSFNYNADDSSMYVSLIKVLTSDEDLTYNNEDKFFIAKINLSNRNNKLFKTSFPVFHSFADVRFQDRVRPYSDYYSNNILMGYPAHLDIYEFNTISKDTRIISINSKILPNELHFNDSLKINAYNTQFFRVLKNKNSDGYFRVAHTKSKELTGVEFKNYLDFRSILVWKKDNGDVSECFLDSSLWSIAYANNDTLYCTPKITNNTKVLTLEKYLITGTKTVQLKSLFKSAAK